MQQTSVPVRDHTARSSWRLRLRAALIHLALSAIVAIVAGLIVFGVWFPYPYREISGGSDLFRLVVAVDVVLGPLITFAIFDAAKPRRELRNDLAAVAILQLAGLAYGLWTVHLARPVHMVFEIDRFRVVHQVEIPVELTSKVAPGIDVAPLDGPTLLSTRPFRDSQEKMEMTLAALGGVHLGARPDLWRSYEEGRSDILAAAKPLPELKRRFETQSTEIDRLIRASGGDPARAVYLPVIGRKPEAWTVLLDSTSAKVLGYVPLDSF